VKYAIKVGYRHIDAAWAYENQDEVGEGIREAIDEKIVKREDLWVTSKLANEFHKKEDVEPHLKDTLSQLGLDYLDLFLIHWPVTYVAGETLTPSTEETWREMEKLVEKGLVKTIGVSNFSAKKLEAMKSHAKIFPAVNQVEAHPMFRQDNLLKACNRLGVNLTAYSPLGSSDSASFEHHKGGSLLKDPTVNEIAKKHDKSAGQILIRWALQRGTSAVPKSVTAKNIEKNFDVFSWDLTTEEMNRLNSFEQTRLFPGNFFVRPEGPYKTHTDLWDE
jgi:alcohol dehydrogenase (NADP+)